MTYKGIQSDINKQLFKALERIDKLEKRLDEKDKQHAEEIEQYKTREKEYKKEIIELKNIIKEKDEKIEKLTNEVNELKGEVLRLKANNKKDSSNSSKPSGTNGYKKVITNTRQKSQNKPGKPKGQNSTNLSEEKIQKLIESGNVEYEYIEINKNNNNKNKPYKIVRVIDLKVVKVIKEYRYYPNIDGTYNIPNYHNRAIQYGENLKTICCCLNNDIYNSTDGIVRFISHITNDGIKLSKSTILMWNKVLASNLSPEINNIEKQLTLSYFLNCDDSGLKINGKSYNDLCICNNTHTLLYISDRKNSKAWEEKTFLKKYKGVIVKDGTEVFNDFGMFLAQCCSHILRYLKGVYDFINHEGAVKMAGFLRKCIHNRKLKINEGFNCFTSKELQKYYDEFNEIFQQWKKEWMKSEPENNPVYEDERRLLSRFEDEIERKQILYFLTDFNVPATNSQAEVDQRGAKIKQKIGKFRSVDGATDYANIKSCILTYKKNSINVYEAIKSAFRNEPIII